MRSGYDRLTATSPVSAATVTHHPGRDEHWTVSLSTTTIAHCTDPDEAAQLAEHLNAAKAVGDAFDRAYPYNTAGTARPGLRPRPRCHGLQITKQPLTTTSDETTPRSTLRCPDEPDDR